jgi:hypothetical protein
VDAPRPSDEHIERLHEDWLYEEHLLVREHPDSPAYERVRQRAAAARERYRTAVLRARAAQRIDHDWPAGA